MQSISPTAVAAAFLCFLGGMIAGKLLPDFDNGSLAALTSPGLTTLDGTLLTSAKIKSGNVRSLTVEESYERCRTMCPFMPASAGPGGGVARPIPQHPSLEN